MLRAAIVIVMAWLLFYWAAPIYSQTAIIYPGKQPELPINKDTLPQDASSFLQIVPTEPIRAETLQAKIKQMQNMTLDKNLFNALYNKPKVDEKEAIRTEWKKAFGADAWYPYYKAKEIEDKVCEKFKIRIFGIKGKPRLENNQARYVFKATF